MHLSYLLRFILCVVLSLSSSSCLLYYVLFIRFDLFSVGSVIVEFFLCGTLNSFDASLWSRPNSIANTSNAYKMEWVTLLRIAALWTNKKWIGEWGKSCNDNIRYRKRQQQTVRPKYISNGIVVGCLRVFFFSFFFFCLFCMWYIIIYSLACQSAATFSYLCKMWIVFFYISHLAFFPQYRRDSTKHESASSIRTIQ